MIHKKAPRGISGVGMYTGALAVAALIPLGAMPTASADVEGGPVDQAIDNLYQEIADFFNPEPATNAFAIDNLSDLFAPEGTPADQMIDAFYQSVSTAFQPEGQIDMFVESLFGLPPF